MLDRMRTSLSKRELLNFMNTELAAFTKNQKDTGVLDFIKNQDRG
jgi:hypothetical protein